MNELKLQDLVLNVLTQEQFDSAEKDATQLYLTPDTSIDSSEKGVSGGVATLDSNAKVPAEQIPELDYVKNSDKAVPNGVASLGADGKVPNAQLPETVLPDNYDYVVDSYSDEEGNWYRVYKSGWVEQGGQLTSQGAGWHTVTFLKPFSFVYNLVNSIVDAPVVQPTLDTIGAKNITNTNFSLYDTGSSSNSWVAIGKGE